MVWSSLLFNITRGTRPYFFLGLISIILYAQTLSFGFTYLDDNALILDQEHYLTQSGTIATAFKEDVFHNAVVQSFYRPLLTISFMIDAHLGGMSPWIFHLSNIVLHAVAVILLFLFLLRLRIRRDTAFLFSLLFAVHPALTQAVAWVPGRNDTLLAVFVLGAMITLIDFLERRRFSSFACHAVCVFLALLTKETAIMLIPIGAVYMLGIAKESYRSFYSKMVVVSWAIIVLFWYALRHAAFPSPLVVSQQDILLSFMQGIPATVIYLGKLFFPFQLSVTPLLIDSSPWYGVAALWMLFVFFFLSRKKDWHLLGLGVIWFFFFLAPTLIMPNAHAFYYHEHRLYLPLIGLIITCVALKDFRWNLGRWVMVSVPFVVIAFFVMTTLHSQNFQNRISFWSQAVKSSPHAPLAHRNLGAMYYLDGRLDEAEKEFRVSLALNPHEAEARNNLGLIYMQRKEYSRAKEFFDAELVDYPLYANVHFNKGLLLYATKDSDGAVAEWKKTIELSPTYYQAYQNLIVASRVKGDTTTERQYSDMLQTIMER